MISDYWACCIHRISNCPHENNIHAKSHRSTCEICILCLFVCLIASLRLCVPARARARVCVCVCRHWALCSGTKPILHVNLAIFFSKTGVLEDRGTVRTVWRGPWFGWEEGRANHRGRDTTNRASKESGHTVVVSEGQRAHEECRRNFTSKHSILIKLPAKKTRNWICSRFFHRAGAHKINTLTLADVVFLWQWS